MVKIFEMQQQLNDISNHQSRVVEFENFREYLQKVNEESLPRKHAVGNKFIKIGEQTITFYFEQLFDNHGSVEFIHFAKVIGEE
jgi:hypothetical protein